MPPATQPYFPSSSTYDDCWRRLIYAGATVPDARRFLTLRNKPRLLAMRYGCIPGESATRVWTPGELHTPRPHSEHRLSASIVRAGSISTPRCAWPGKPGGITQRLAGAASSGAMAFDRQLAALPALAYDAPVQGRVRGVKTATPVQRPKIGGALPGPNPDDPSLLGSPPGKPTASRNPLGPVCCAVGLAEQNDGRVRIAVGRDLPAPYRNPWSLWPGILRACRGQPSPQPRRFWRPQR